jgi:hypothetical protein
VEASFLHQLQAWQQEQDALKQVDLSHGHPFGVNIDDVLANRGLGQSLAENVGLLKTLFAQVTGQDTIPWTWDRLPYTVRCAGLAQCAADEDDRPRKKGRIDDEEHFVKDVDEWFAMTYSP